MEAPAAEVPMEMLITLQGGASNPVRLHRFGHSFHQGQGLVLHHPYLSHTDIYIFSSLTTQDTGFECSNTTFFKLATSVGIGWLTAL